jgi:hypothetical protein
MRTFVFFDATLMITSTVLLVALLASSPVQAHLVLKDPVARTDENNLTEKPCGGIPAGDSVATYTAGTDIEITVNVPIRHSETLHAAISYDNFATATELAMIQIPQKGMHKMTVPLPAQPLGPAVLQVSHERYVSCADITVTGEALFAINAGLNDAWVSAGAPLQGMFVTVYPVLKLIFVAWFTFDSEQPSGDVSAVFGAPDQRWITLLGFYEGNRVDLKGELTSGGKFNSQDPLPTQDTGYGTMTIEFSNCSQGSVAYDFPAAGESGSFNIQRVLESNVALCEALNAQ